MKQNENGYTSNKSREAESLLNWILFNQKRYNKYQSVTHKFNGKNYHIYYDTKLIGDFKKINVTNAANELEALGYIKYFTYGKTSYFLVNPNYDEVEKASGTNIIYKTIPTEHVIEQPQQKQVAYKPIPTAPIIEQPMMYKPKQPVPHSICDTDVKKRIYDGLLRLVPQIQENKLNYTQEDFYVKMIELLTKTYDKLNEIKEFKDVQNIFEKSDMIWNLCIEYKCIPQYIFRLYATLEKYNLIQVN